MVRVATRWWRLARFAKVARVARLGRGWGGKSAVRVARVVTMSVVIYHFIFVAFH